MYKLLILGLLFFSCGQTSERKMAQAKQEAEKRLQSYPETVQSVRTEATEDLIEVEDPELEVLTQALEEQLKDSKLSEAQTETLEALVSEAEVDTKETKEVPLEDQTEPKEESDECSPVEGLVRELLDAKKKIKILLEKLEEKPKEKQEDEKKKSKKEPKKPSLKDYQIKLERLKEELRKTVWEMRIQQKEKRTKKQP